MAFTTAFINSTLDSAFAGTVTMHLYTVGLPSTTGVEVVGGSYSAQTLALGAASGKVKATTTNATFTDLPSVTIVAYGIKIGGVLKDEGLLSPSFTADVTNNTLDISYEADWSGL